MGTIRERLIKILVSKGMPDHQAEKALDSASVKLDKFLNGYGVNWNDPESDLAFIAYSKVWESVLIEAGLNWIRKNNQHANYRRNFEEGANGL